MLRIAKASDVIVIGGTLLGDRAEHKSKAGEWGMGIRIGPNVKRVTIIGVTAKEMWGDGFYVEGATDVAFCSVVATHNRRQGLSIVEANRLLVTNSVFQQTRGTRPSAGIDIEPDKPDQKVDQHPHRTLKVHQQRRRRRDDCRQARHRCQRGDRPQRLRRGAANSHRERPQVRSTAICDNRHIGQQDAPPQEGLNAFAETVEVVSLQADCRSGRDLRFEMNRGNTKKKKKKPAN